jgi:prophage regulatory protein
MSYAIETASPLDRFLRLDEVLKHVPVCRSTLYNMINAGSFPKPIKLSKRLSVWRDSAVTAWMESLTNGQEQITD